MNLEVRTYISKIRDPFSGIMSCSTAYNHIVFGGITIFMRMNLYRNPLFLLSLLYMSLRYWKELRCLSTSSTLTDAMLRLTGWC